MICRGCGVQLPDGTEKCPNCGEIIALKGDEVAVAPPSSVPQNIPESEQSVANLSESKTTKRKKTKWLWIGIAAAVVIACAILIPIMIENARANRYEMAVSLMEVGEAQEAKTEFVELGEYLDSQDKADDCQNILDYDAAKVHMDKEEYPQAKEIYVQLKDYEQSAELAEECQRHIDYAAATKLMEEEQHESARDAFDLLVNFKDSEELSAECQRKLDYDAAVLLMDKEDYEEAIVAFKALEGYLDTKKLATDCQRVVYYKEAVEAFELGKFYSAYEKFGFAGMYSDARERAKKCIQTMPESKEIYRNPDYSRKRISFTFKSPSKARNICIKIYTEDDVHVSTVFVAPKKKVKVKLPSGRFKFKIGFGDKWFGDQAFGDIGKYELMLFEDAADSYKLSTRYYYTLDLPEDAGKSYFERIDPEDF